MGTDGHPIEGDSDALAIDVENPTARYTRACLVAHPDPILLEGADSMHPIMRGLSMVPCDPESCCGSCFTIPAAELADLKAALNGDTQTTWWACELCGKLRKAHGGTNADATPDGFTCHSKWDARYQSCEAPQEGE